MTEGGWIKLNRRALDHPLFAGNPERLGAWAWLLLRAAWRPTRQDVAGTIVTVERGQIVTSYRQLASAWGWSVKSVRTFLAKLEAEGGIKKEITSGNGKTAGPVPDQSGSKTGTASRGGGGTGRLLLTICKYDAYQSSGEAAGTPEEPAAGTAGAQQGHSRGTEKKKGRREEEVERGAQPASAGDASKPDARPRTSRGTRLPRDWTLPEEGRRYALSIGLDEVSVRRQAVEFRDYWCSKAGQDARKVDWHATWQRWARRAFDDMQGPRRPGSEPSDPTRGMNEDQRRRYHQKLAEMGRGA